MPKTLWSKGLLVVLLAAVSWVAVIYARVVHQSGKDEARRTDAIVVFGAAQYGGKPSPVYKARLDHAAHLYHQGLAPIVITTGGAGADPDFTEGVVGREYLKTLGIPDSQLIAETQSPDTAESARRVATIMRTNGMKSCVTVSDGYHMFRIRQMLTRENIVAYGSPRPYSKPHSLWKRNAEVLHEVTSYTLWVLHLS
ncbi:MAG TPA: YdcF family protein [Candidatus Angelobacter sp.]|nr:YdcF family protein [Candidatus Angelobacter sp.]